MIWTPEIIQSSGMLYMVREDLSSTDTHIHPQIILILEVMKGVSKMDSKLIEKIAKSRAAFDESSRLKAEARQLEYEVMTAIFAAHGIKIGETVVRNKETGRCGVLHFIDQGYSAGIFYNVGFYPITQRGTESTRQSYDDRGNWWYIYSGELNTPEGVYSGFEAMADCYEVAK